MFVLICALMALNEAVVSPVLVPENYTETYSHHENVNDTLRHVSANETETHGHGENVTEPTSEDVAHGCPVGWTQYHSRCFLYISCAMSWTEAKRHCQYMNANLASIHGNEEDEALRRVIKGNRRAWIGGSDMRREDEWQWADGSRFSYDFWCPNEPNDARGNEDCLLVNWKGSGCWNDGNCNDQYPFVCAK